MNPDLHISQDHILLNKKLSKKREFDSSLYALINKIRNKIKKYDKTFKFNEIDKNKLLKSLDNILKKNSSEKILSVVKDIFPDLNDNLYEHDFILNCKVVSYLNSNTLKIRSYDIDTNKKLLRKNIWNFIQKLISDYHDLSHIKYIKDEEYKCNKIINFTNREYEKDLMKTKIKDLYEKYYGISFSTMQTLCKNNKDRTKLEEILNKTFEEHFIEYRESDKFFEDTDRDCYDHNKLNKYKLIATRYLNYLNCEQKIILEKLEDDEILTEKFKLNLNNFLKEKEENMKIGNTNYLNNHANEPLESTTILSNYNIVICKYNQLPPMEKEKVISYLGNIKFDENFLLQSKKKPEINSAEFFTSTEGINRNLGNDKISDDYKNQNLSNSNLSKYEYKIGDFIFDKQSNDNQEEYDYFFK